jgi:hypothetical protein
MMVSGLIRRRVGPNFEAFLEVIDHLPGLIRRTPGSDPVAQPGSHPLVCAAARPNPSLPWNNELCAPGQRPSRGHGFP